MKIFNRILPAGIIVVGLGVAAIAANYTATQGQGTTFGSIVVSAVNYAQQLICDQTTPSQCAGVNSSNQLAIQAPPSLPLPSGAATSANQTNATQKTQAVDGSGNGMTFSTYGSTPTGYALSGNVYVTNTNANGSATSANSSPVVIASDQTAAGSKNAGTAAAQSWLAGAVYNSSPLTLSNTNQASLQADANGYLKVNVAAGGASGGTSSSFGSAFPGTGTAIGLTNGTNMVAWSATTNYGTAPSAIAVPAVNAYVTGALGLAQGSTTSGQTGSMIMGAVTTSAPSYTTAQTAYASLDTSGNLRVNCASGCAGGSFNNNSDAVATSSSNGQTAAWLYGFNGTTFDRLQVDGSKNLKVTATGAISNASSAVATASTNIAGVSYNYGFNGTTWDQLQVDGSKNLKVVVSGALTANQSVNTAQVNGVTTLTGTGATGTGAQRVTVAQDTATIAGSAVGTAGSASANVVTVQGAGSMTPILVTQSANADPCSSAAKTNVPISTASGTVALVSGVSAKKIYVCSFSLITTTAVSVSLSEGSGATCGTSSQAGVIGVATNGTAANGLPLAANGGLTLGNGGGTIAQTATAANYLCLFQSGTAQVAGNITYVQQ